MRARNYSGEIGQFLRLLDPKKNDVILDLGAGTGYIANEVARYCDEVYAAEPVSKRVDFIKAKYPAVKAFIATGEAISFPEGYFDKCYVVAAFHHFQNQDLALEELARVLKSEGVLLVHEFDANHLGILMRIEARLLKRNVAFLSEDKLEEKLSQHDFEIIQSPSANKGFFLLAKKNS